MAKCPVCRGKGYRLRIDDMRFAMAEIVKCESCDGKGVVEPLTEQEYIQTCTTEQLADVIGNIAKNAYQCGQNGKTNKCVNRHNCTGYCDYGWGEWLKQPHREENEK